MLALGALVRFWGLGAAELAPDEAFQIFAARGLIEHGRPVLPSGEAYTRGIDVTHLVAWSMQLFGDSVVAARLPNAVLSWLTLVVFALVVRGMAGLWAAVWATLLLALYPEAVFQGRFLRFYSYQLIFGILALGAGWRALRLSASEAGSEQRWRVAGWLTVAFGLLALAARVQLAALSTAAGFMVAVALFGAIDLVRRGGRGFRDNPPLLITAAMVVAALAVLLLRPEVVAETWEASQDVAAWAAGGGHPLAYYWALSHAYPTIINLLPIVFLVAAWRHPRLAVYLALWFGVPLLLHSLLFTWKGERFIFLAVPAMLAAAGVAIASLFGIVYRILRRSARHLATSPRQRSGLVAAGAILGVAWTLLTLPALHRTLDVLDQRTFTGWQQAAQVIQSRPDLGGAPIASNNALIGMYYTGRADLKIPRANFDDFSWSSSGIRPDTVDFYSGARVAMRPADVERAMDPQFGILFGMIEGKSRERWVEELLMRADTVCALACQPMTLFHLPPGRARAPGAPLAPAP